MHNRAKHSRLGKDTFTNMAAAKTATAPNAVNTAPVTNGSAAESDDEEDEFKVHVGIQAIGETGNWTPTKSLTPKGRPAPLVGWCLRTEPRVSPKYPDKPYIAGIVEITQPTRVVATDNSVRTQSKGLVSLTVSVAQLTELVEKFDDPEYVYQYQFIGAARSERANGHTFQEYDVQLLNQMTRADYDAMKIKKLQEQLTGAGGNPALAGGAKAPQLAAGEA